MLISRSKSYESMSAEQFFEDDDEDDEDDEWTSEDEDWMGPPFVNGVGYMVGHEPRFQVEVVFEESTSKEYVTCGFCSKKIVYEEEGGYNRRAQMILCYPFFGGGCQFRLAENSNLIAQCQKDVILRHSDCFKKDVFIK